MGFFSQVSGPFTLDTNAFGSPENGDYAILRSLTKSFPTNGELHTAVWAALELRPRIPDLGAISAIHIETTEFNCRVLADAEKFHPKTRETADHSLPFNVARALIDGDITIETYSDAKIAGARAAALMSMTKVSEDPVLTAMFPQQLPNRVTVTLASGQTISSEVVSGPGSLENPMSDKDFEQKLRRMAGCWQSASGREFERADVACAPSSGGRRPSALGRTDRQPATNDAMHVRSVF